jgi:hypothetical protein
MHELRMSQEPRPGGREWRRIALVFLVLLLPGLLGAWRIMSGDTIDPRNVQRIQDGKTTKMEVMTLFGDPQDINRDADGLTYIYKSFKDAPATPYKPWERQINPQSDKLYVIDADKQIKKPPLKTKGKILKSTLTIRFKPGTNTVMSHEYQEY